MNTTDRRKQAEDQRQKEVIILIVMRAIKLASASAILFVVASLALSELGLFAAILAVSVGICGWASTTIGSSKVLIRWYKTIIEQEDAKYLRYGDGSKQR